MGILSVKDIRFRSRHGNLDFEREVGNTFSIDLICQTDLRKAAKTDRLSDTLDYAPAVAAVREIMEGESVHLIETLLDRIGESLMARFPDIMSLEVHLRKLHPPIPETCEYVELVDHWER